MSSARRWWRGPRRRGVPREAGCAGPEPETRSPRPASGSAEDADVAAHRAAAQDDGRPGRSVLVDRRLARERNLGGEVARGRAGVDVEERARRDADLDVPGHAAETDV